MIMRIWRGWATADNADAYQQLLQREIVPGIMGRRIDGLHELVILRRADDAVVEFVTLMTFDDVNAVRTFAGEQYRTAVVPAAAQALLHLWDTESMHYDITAVHRPS